MDTKSQLKDQIEDATELFLENPQYEGLYFDLLAMLQAYRSIGNAEKLLKRRMN